MQKTISLVTLEVAKKVRQSVNLLKAPGPIFPNSSNRHVISEEIETKTTMCYRAPEMCDLYSGKWIDEKSDIWVTLLL